MRPNRIITAVEKEFSTSFWAVPAFIRVEPAIGSGPVSTAITMSAGTSPGSGLEVSSAVRAPSCLASRSAASTNGVRPEAAKPMTKSALLACRRITAAPESVSSSAFSTARTKASSPPAWWATNQSGGALNVGTSSAASSTASRPDVPAPT